MVAGFVKSVRAAGRKADVIVTGGLNDRGTSLPVQALTKGAGLADLPAALPAGDRYTAVTGGNSEDLDHILLSPALAKSKHRFDVVHRASEFAARAGDHDPTVVRIDLPGK